MPTLSTTTLVDGPSTVLKVRPRADFVETPTVRDLTERALAYLAAGFPVHLRGPSGTGKTTLALHVAARLGRPVMLIAGDDEFATSDLIGGQHGYRYRKVRDNFIHSVLKIEEDAVKRWVDHRLTTACREGFTLVYDEFTRSRPEANNVLLAVLEEQLLILPTMDRKDGYLKVHPDFRAIFTSNPKEYAGVHETQDALSDRLVTLDLDYYDRETEIAITRAKSGLAEEDAAHIVDVVRDFRATGEYDQTPTLRACIMIASVLARRGQRPAADNPYFVQVCLDLLESRATFAPPADERRSRQRKMILDLIAHHCREEADDESQRTA